MLSNLLFSLKRKFFAERIRVPSGLNIVIIAAKAGGDVIGYQNSLPWSLPEDMAFFKEKTKTKPIIMGRKTFESLKSKPLPNRINIVISKSLAETRSAPPATYFVSSINEALNCAKTHLKDLNADNKDVMIVGGAEIYKQFIGIASEMLITQIDACFNKYADAFFPRFEEAEWSKHPIVQHQHSEKGAISYSIYEYKRAGKAKVLFSFPFGFSGSFFKIAKPA